LLSSGVLALIAGMIASSALSAGIHAAAGATTVAGAAAVPRAGHRRRGRHGGGR